MTELYTPDTVASFRADPALDETVGEVTDFYTMNVNVFSALNPTLEMRPDVRLRGDVRLLVRRHDLLDFEWERYRVTEPTLAEVCRTKSADPLRGGAEPLTPAYVWRHILNAGFRRAHLAALLSQQPMTTDPHAFARETDEHPERVRLIANSELHIPYPAEVLHGAVRIAPGTTQSPTHQYIAMPRELSELLSHLMRLRRDTSELREANRECKRAVESLVEACAPLVIVKQMITALGGIPSLGTAATALADLSSYMNTNWIGQPERRFSERFANRREIATRILPGAPRKPGLGSLRNERFRTLVAWALRQPEEYVTLAGEEKTLTQWLCSTLGDAFTQLLAAPETTEAARSEIVAVFGGNASSILGQVLAMHSASEDEPTPGAHEIEGPSLVATLAGVFGTLGAVTATSMDLPGPKSLTAVLIGSLQTEVLDQVSRAADRQAGEALRATTVHRYASLIGVSPHELEEALAAHPDRRELKKWFSEGRPHTAAQQHLLLGLSLVAFTGAFIHVAAGEGTAADVITLTQSGVQLTGGVAGALSFVRRFSAENSATRVIAEGAGKLGCILGVLGGGIQFATEPNWQHGLAELGNALGLAAELFEIPNLQVPAVALAFVDGAVEFYHLFRESLMPKIQRAMLAQLEKFKDNWDDFLPQHALMPAPRPETPDHTLEEKLESLHDAISDVSIWGAIPRHYSFDHTFVANLTALGFPREMHVHLLDDST